MKISAAYVWAVFSLLLISAAGGLNASPDETLNDEDVKLVSFQDLAYPPLARSARVQGVVVIRAKLDDQGNVVDASAVSGAKSLIPACLSNAKKWRFKPNSRNAAVIVYEFRFADGSCHDRTNSLFLLRHQNFASITACDPVLQ